MRKKTPDEREHSSYRRSGFCTLSTGMICCQEGMGKAEGHGCSMEGVVPHR